jgi:hypothetical protein
MAHMIRGLVRILLKSIIISPWLINNVRIIATFFTVVWLDDSEKSDLTKELISGQYDYFVEHNNFTMDGSNHSQHAQQYGDLSIAAKQHVSDYQGINFISKIKLI